MLRPRQPALPVIPYLVTGGTDSKHYAPLSKYGVLRFVPFALTRGDLGRIHGTDERTKASDFVRAVCTYSRMLQLFGEMGSSP